MEILRVGSTGDVVHGALYDGPLGAGRYVMGEPNRVARQEQLGQIDSGDPEQLIASACWLFEAYPAERYGLVLWSHGSGWEPSEVESIARVARPVGAANTHESRLRAAAPGSRALFRTTLRSMLSAEAPAERAILFDDGTGHSLDTLELARVTATIAQAIGQPLELLGMDACLMASLEVAYEIRDSVRYLVASQELVPGYSWPYERIFGALRAAADQPGADLAQRIVTEYVRYYQERPPAAGDITKVALDLARISAFAGNVDSLAAALVAELDAAAPLTWTAQDVCFRTETRNGTRQPNKFQFHLWDVGTLTRQLASTAPNPQLRAETQSLLEALRPGAGPVLAEGHVGNWFNGIAGTSIYLARPPTRVSPYYSTLAFAKDTHWGEYVRAYRDFFP